MRVLVAVVVLCLAIGLAAPAARAESAEQYFPSGTWWSPGSKWSQEKSDVFYQDWFGGQLAAMQEAPLWTASEADASGDVIRLLFSPTFSRPSVLRLTKTGTGDYLYDFRQSDGAGGYDPGQLVLQDQGRLTLGQADQLAGLLAEVQPRPLYPDFTGKPDADGNTWGCFDGTQTVLEVRLSGTYHAIKRHECELPPDAPLWQVILLMDEIAKGRMIAPGTGLTRLGAGQRLRFP